MAIVGLEGDIGPSKNLYAFCEIPTKKLLYVAVTKSGSTTIRHLLGLSLGIHIEDNDMLVKSTELAERWQDYFKFSFVRNPYDRMVSCYRDKVLGKGLNLEPGEATYFETRAPQMSRTTSFEEFVDTVCGVEDCGANSHLRSQYSLLYIDGVPLFDWLGRLENFKEDWRVIADRFNLPQIEYRTNASNTIGESYKGYYTPELAEKIYNRYALDFINFNYDKESYA